MCSAYVECGDNAEAARVGEELNGATMAGRELTTSWVDERTVGAHAGRLKRARKGREMRKKKSTISGLQRDDGVKKVAVSRKELKGLSKGKSVKIMGNKLNSKRHRGRKKKIKEKKLELAMRIATASHKSGKKGTLDDGYTRRYRRKK